MIHVLKELRYYTVTFLLLTFPVKGGRSAKANFRPSIILLWDTAEAAVILVWLTHGYSRGLISIACQLLERMEVLVEFSQEPRRLEVDSRASPPTTLHVSPCLSLPLSRRIALLVCKISVLIVFDERLFSFMSASLPTPFLSSFY